ncbi:hypothetical protein EZS27_009371 [termite gut metagenome]|uniref:Uncharacterized protein n=1 Tax=termite gut metagenome TaxID=433724 RepID=A0A5J4SCC9_9ZZZZ
MASLINQVLSKDRQIKGKPAISDISLPVSIYPGFDFATKANNNIRSKERSENTIVVCV